MTSKETPSDDALAYVRHRLSDHAIILAGRLPRLPELHAGAPFMGGRIELDIMHFVDDFVASNPGIREEERVRAIRAGTTTRILRRLRAKCDSDAMRVAREALLAIDETTAAARVDCYLACSGDAPARLRVADRILSGMHGIRNGLGHALRTCVAHALISSSSHRGMDGYCSSGIRDLAAITADLNGYRAALEQINAEPAPRSDEDKRRDELLADVRGVDADDEDFLRAVAEDRAEYWRPGQRSIIVVPPLPDSTPSQRERKKSWNGLDGQSLPLVMRGDVAAQRQQLVDRWPHAAEIVDIVLGDLAARDVVLFRPTLLVGPPGSGKSSLARAIADEVGLPSELYSLAGMSDSSLMGTSAQWSTSRESAPLQLIKRSKSANVAVIWDEIEKASQSRHNGSGLDALLPMLEPDQARRYRDLALECEVDLGFVSHFGTANSLDDIPAPLRDRMRILQMPEPQWQHIGALTRQIVDRIARERGVDPRWFQPLAEDEIELVRAAWPGGSLRQLTRIVTTILDGRDQILGRA